MPCPTVSKTKLWKRSSGTSVLRMNCSLRQREASLRLYHAILAQGELFFILFSGNRQRVLLDKLEDRLKKASARFPQYRNNLEFDILMTVLIQGCSHAFLNYRLQDPEQVIEILGQASERLLLK